MNQATIPLRGEGLPTFLRRCMARLDGIPHSAVAAVARLGLAGVFFQSGRTKVDGFRVYVPDETRSQFIEHKTIGCANPKVHLLEHKAYH